MQWSYTMNKKLTGYHTPAQTAEATFKDRSSTFTAYLFPVASADDIKGRLAELKKLHPKAVHHCFAYRMGTDGNQYRAQDDGEPAGSAGKPILGQIDSFCLTNVLIVVVRYFGGTLLGVPGLINAYKSAAKQAIEGTTLIPFVELVHYTVQCYHGQWQEVCHILRTHASTITHIAYGEPYKAEVAIPEHNEAMCVEKISKIYTVNIAKK